MGGVFVLLYLGNFLLAWPVTRWSGISNGEFLFGDFSWLSRWSNECRLDLSIPNLFSIYSQIQTSDTCPGYNYGMPLLILLSVFPISWSSYVLIALIVGVVGLFSLGVFLARSFEMTSRRRILIILAVFSPGVLLLFERGNLDLIILLMVILAGLLFKNKFVISALLVLSSASLMKFYTAPLVLLIALVVKNRRQQVVAWIVTFITFVWVAIDMSRGPELPSEGFVQFGYSVLNHYFVWLGVLLQPLPSILGFVIPMLVWAFLVINQRNLNWHSEKGLRAVTNSLSEDYVFLFTGLTFCAMFFVGLSYDYRLVFLAVAGVALILKSSFGRGMNVFLWGSLLIALWGSGVLGNGIDFIPPTLKPALIGGFQLAGDLSVFLWVGILLYFCALVLANKIAWFSKILGIVTLSTKSK